jgi:hypothetical protein
METVRQALAALLSLLVDFVGLILAAIGGVEVWIRSQLSLAGVNPQLQTVILIALAVLLIVGAFRLFGGLLRIIIVIFLLLIAIKMLVPALHG